MSLETTVRSPGCCKHSQAPHKAKALISAPVLPHHGPCLQSLPLASQPFLTSSRSPLSWGRVQQVRYHVGRASPPISIFCCGCRGPSVGCLGLPQPSALVSFCKPPTSLDKRPQKGSRKCNQRRVDSPRLGAVPLLLYCSS